MAMANNAFLSVPSNRYSLLDGTFYGALLVLLFVCELWLTNTIAK